MTDAQRTWARREGFTLLEVLLAGAVLAVAAVGLAAGLAQGDRMTDSARQTMLARNATRSMIANISSCNFSEVAKLYHRRGFLVPGLSPAPGDTDGMPGEIELAYGPGEDTSFYRATVRVRWRDRSGERVLETVRYLANVRGDTGDPVPLSQLTQNGGVAGVP